MAEAKSSDRLPSLVVGAFVVGLFCFLAFQQITDGRIFVEKWSGDAAFVFDIILRIEAGQVPHVDFTLHLGAMPYLLAAILGGQTVAESFLLAQSVFSATCLLIGIWVWRTRLSTLAGLLLMSAVTFFGMSHAIPSLSELSLALFYNRWCWSMTFLFACLTLLPSKFDQSAPVDGVLVGIIGFGLLMTKITFFVGLMPAAILCSVLRRQWRELAYGIAVFLALLLICQIAEPMLILGYLENIVWAAVNPLRPNAGTGLIALLSGEGLVIYTIIFGIFLIAVARTRGGMEGAWWLIAAAGLYFIQYQNALTTPYWIVFLAIYALHYATETGTRVSKRVWSLLSLVLLAFSMMLVAPMLNGLSSNKARASSGEFLPFPPNGNITTGAYFKEEDIRPVLRANSLTFSMEAPWTENPECNFIDGWAGAAIEIAATLAALPGPTFIADSITPNWYLEGIEPLPGTALWNYGSTRGLENAEYVLVPVCGIKPNYKREILRQVERSGVTLSLFLENEHATVYRIEQQ